MVLRAHAARTPSGVTPIESLADSRVAEYHHISNPDALRRAGLFVAEGRLVVRRLLANARFRTHSLLVTAAAYDSLKDSIGGNAIDVFLVDQRTMNGIAGFNIHRGCLALAHRPPQTTLSNLGLDRANRVVVMEGVNNPDNVGGIFRTAAAFATDAVVLGPACSDPLYRKSIRTSMAATLAVPFADAGSWPHAIDALRAHGLRVIALTPAADARPIEELPRDLDRIAILVGSEGEGLSRDAVDAADDRVRIRMPGATDSLNVAVAASIALHWFAQKAG
jgi:tRNA G18 (ribose-2'-O)-methylase SpoU